LQLDIANFFNSIHRPTLFGLLQKRLVRAVRRQGLAREEARALQAHCRALLEADPTAGVRRKGSPALFEQVPPHKRLGALGPGVGLPIGNLTSQFFANVYLNELDQFVKHTLKARWYVRYVDDFVLLHHDPAQLEQWRDEIVAFLDTRLRLRLRGDNIAKAIAAEAAPTGGGEFVRKTFGRAPVGGASAPIDSPVNHRSIAAKAAPTGDEVFVGGASAPIANRVAMPQPRPVSAGVDFLGYVIRPFYKLVRRRVIHHLYARLAEFERHHVRPNALRLPPAERDLLRAQVASYLGHLRHAHSYRLWLRTLENFPWLNHVFIHLENALCPPFVGAASAAIKPWLDAETIGAKAPPTGARPKVFRTKTAPLHPAWEPVSVTSLAGQYHAFTRQFPDACVLMQVGKHWLVAGKPAPTRGEVFVGGDLAPIHPDAIAAKAAPTGGGEFVGGASAPKALPVNHRAIAGEPAPTGARPKAFRTKNGQSASLPRQSGMVSVHRPGLGRCVELPVYRLAEFRRKLKRAGIPHVLAAQTGHFKSGFKRRATVLVWRPTPDPLNPFLSLSRRGAT
jgi:hypothetical protein